MNHVAESSSLMTSFRGVRRLLRLRGPLADDPAARIFHTLLLAFFAWDSVQLAFVPFLAINRPIVALLICGLLATLLISLSLLRKGLSRPSSFVYLFGS